MHHRSYAVVLLFAGTLAACFESSPREKIHASASVDSQDPSIGVPGKTTVFPVRANVDIAMAGGALHVFVGDSGAIAEAAFDYDWAPMRPELKLTSPDRLLDRLRAGEFQTVPVEVTVRQPDLPERPERSENVWKIELNGSRVATLAVTQGVGAAEITVQGPAVESVNLRLGTGVMTIDLTGVVRSLTGHIEQNNGRLVLKLPRRHGVKVHRKLMAGYAMMDGVEQKDATWTSKNFEEAPLKVDLDVLVFAGELEMTTE